MKTGSILMWVLWALSCSSTRMEERSEPDPFMDALPKSGDPTRPNIMVSVTVTDVSDRQLQAIRGGVHGSLVQGILDVRATLGGDASDRSSTTQTSSFIVVQTGGSGSVTLTDDARRLTGLPVTGIQVNVISVVNDVVELELMPFSSATSVPGESFSGSTRVSVRHQEALVIGGIETRRQSSGRELFGAHQESMGRHLLALLVVKIIG